MTRGSVDGVRRHFVTVGGRQLHYRRAGKGPPLVLLHHLPRSSQDVEPLLARWQQWFTVFAPDQAGYGQSWGLESSPSSEAYASDLLALLDALGLQRVHIVGGGTGALLGLRVAFDCPRRLESLVCHGIPDAPVPDIQLSSACPPFEPRWDGSHLAWLWAYLREEAAFEPWRPKALANRRLEAMPSADRIAEYVVQFLSGASHGRGYDTGIRALLKEDPIARARSATVPTLMIGARSMREDALIERIGAPVSLAPRVECRIVERRTDVWPTIDQWLLERRVAMNAPPAPRVHPIAGELWSDYVTVDGGQVHFQSNTDASTVPLLVQHDAASSVGTVSPIVRSLAGRRTVFAFDLPGSGDSDNLIGSRQAGVADYSDLLDRALSAAGLERIDFYGMWGGGLVGLQLAHDHVDRVRKLVMSNVLFHEGEELRQVQDGYTPDVSPVWHGGHLLQCWHQMRDQGLFFPWFDRSERGILRREPYLDTAMVHERVCSLLKAGNMYRTAYQAHFVYPTLERLRSSPVPTMVATADWDPNRSKTEAAAAAASDVVLRTLDADFRRWGLSFVDFLEDP